ncbi:YafY family transcriptional regulator [Rhizobium sp. XQZ8]|uniref:helix-turn-helix transcriptional regulator n=1 Tax=Rhizobium populisoli TaxID=2859785 RepID=UPI001C6682E7|nr:YafY family protein [Rhizobium populisoli]MBW6421410.1 YafY family transcriptional regulator [Rhizobium populisoli]
MPNSGRMFEIVQLLRAAHAPLTADHIAARLEVTKRTVYRDIAALQSARVPIEGAAGIGYVMRSGFDLPPLMFTPEEIEAITVGLSLIARTGDTSLREAGGTVMAKIGAIRPAHEPPIDETHLLVSPWHAIPDATVDLRVLRRAIREERKLKLSYRNGEGISTTRIVRPIAVIYYIEGVLLATFCELRQDFRHFRHDRIEACEPLDSTFKGESAPLRKSWRVSRALFDDPRFATSH